jgi:dTDP-4-amino-4,6-dideoxygalactose transaminase
MKSKQSVHHLAIMGGEPAFVEPLHVGHPHIGSPERLFARINQMLARKSFTNNGPFVQELEQHLAEYLGVKHCLLVCNGTIGLQIALQAMGLSGEVIVPAFTFVATVHALQSEGLKPVFCDVDPITHTLDPVQVERLITADTSAILGVHLWGHPCSVEQITEIAHRHQLKLLYDAAHAFGCSWQGRMIGNFGEGEVFSFHATKFFHTFEGGAITTNVTEVAEKVRLLRNFGFAGLDNVISIGTNGKMSEVSAAMGLTLLEDLDTLITKNRQNYRQYQTELGGVQGIRLVTYDETERQNFQYIVLEVDNETTGIDRDRLVDILRAENVFARRYFFPGCHRMEPYRSLTSPDQWNLPVTEKLAKKVLCLPTGSTIDQSAISEICHIIRLSIQNAAVFNSVDGTKR